MRVLFIASGEFAIPTLDRLVADGFNIPLVITQPDRKAGRGRKLAPTPTKTAALKRDLEVAEAENINDEAWIARVTDLNIDVGVVIAFGQKIKQPFRDGIRGGCINLHASLLPKYRGAAPFQWAVLNGESETGVTVFKLVDRMDAGPILTSVSTAIAPQETAAELHDRLSLLGPEAVLKAVQMFENGRVPDGQPQNDNDATLAPKLTKQDGHIDWSQPATRIAAHIHGMWSWPGATCRFQSADGSRDEIVTVARVRTMDGQTNQPHGTIDADHRVATGDGLIAIEQIKPAASALMDWSAFVNGRHVSAGDRFVSIAAE